MGRTQDGVSLPPSAAAALRSPRPRAVSPEQLWSQRTRGTAPGRPPPPVLPHHHGHCGRSVPSAVRSSVEDPAEPGLHERVARPVDDPCREIHGHAVERALKTQRVPDTAPSQIAGTTAGTLQRERVRLRGAPEPAAEGRIARRADEHPPAADRDPAPRHRRRGRCDAPHPLGGRGRRRSSSSRRGHRVARSRWRYGGPREHAP
jgi:hypothetical protein